MGNTLRSVAWGFPFRVKLKWGRAGTNAIKLALKSRRNNPAERLGSRLGVDIVSLKEKIQEIEEVEKIRRMVGFAAS